MFPRNNLPMQDQVGAPSRRTIPIKKNGQITRWVTIQNGCWTVPINMKLASPPRAPREEGIRNNSGGFFGASEADFGCFHNSDALIASVYGGDSPWQRYTDGWDTLTPEERARLARLRREKADPLEIAMLFAGMIALPVIGVSEAGATLVQPIATASRYRDIVEFIAWKLGQVTGENLIPATITGAVIYGITHPNTDY